MFQHSAVPIKILLGDIASQQIGILIISNHSKPLNNLKNRHIYLHYKLIEWNLLFKVLEEQHDSKAQRFVSIPFFAWLTNY